LACIPAAIAITNCGGGGSSPSSPPPPPPPSATTVSGSVVKGPCNGTTVRILNAATGAQLATTTTNATGAYTVDVTYTGDVIVEATGGSCADEATGGTTSLTSTMRSVMAVSGASVTGMVTPLTTLAYTFAFGNATTGVTSTAFNTKATSVATQFQLTGTNIVTTAPVVTGTTNAYGQVLRAIAQYLHDNGTVTLGTLTTSYFTSNAQWTAFNTAFNNAYHAANPASNVSFTFDGSSLVIGGTGIGGGNGSCGIHVQGSVSASGVTVPLALDYCIQGIAAGSCGSGNAALSSALAGQSGLAGAVNLNYTFGPTCAANAITITLQ